MIIKNRIINTLVSIGVTTMLILPFAGCGKSKTLASGYIWEVTETTKLKSLNIANGASIYAPNGYSLTMTVDGVETGIKPGAYKGKIMLRVTKTL